MSLKHFSVSALKLFRLCPRRFHDQYVSGKKEPPSLALDRGNKLDQSIESVALGAAVAELPDYRVYVDAVRPYLAPPDEEALIQHWMRLPTQFGIPFVGKLDYVRHRLRPKARLIDWKSTSNPRYMLSPEEVREDEQVNIYARYLFEEGLEEPLEGGLIYVVLHPEKKPPKTAAQVKVVPRIVDIPRARTQKIWDELQPDLEKMLIVSEETDRNRIEAKITACDTYPPNGCPFKSDCGISLLVGLANKNKIKNNSEGESLMSFRDRLKNKNGQAGAGVPVTQETKVETKTESNSKPESKIDWNEKKDDKPQPSPQAGGGYAARMRANRETARAGAAPGQIVPDDAPPRDSGGADPIPQETVAEAPSDVVTSAETSRGPGRPKGSRSKKANGNQTVAPASEGLTIFVDCWPVKGYGGIEPTLFDDWIGPVLFELNDWAEKEKKIPHYQLLSFSEEKAAVALAIQDRITKGCLPGVLAISTSSNLARDVLPMLLPHATQVVRALRG